MDVTYTLNEKNIIELHTLYLSQWWAKDRSLEETQQCVEGSQLCIALLDNNGKLQGFARVLTDYVFKALIFDVIIAKEYRKQGLGDKLITLIKQHSDLARVKHFELYCLPELEPFYHSHNFTSDVGNIRLMRYTNV